MDTQQTSAALLALSHFFKDQVGSTKQGTTSAGRMINELNHSRISTARFYKESRAEQEKNLRPWLPRIGKVLRAGQKKGEREGKRRRHGETPHKERTCRTKEKASR